MATKRYAIIHQGLVTVAARPGSTDPVPAPVPAKPDPSVSVGILDSSGEPSLLPITIAAYDPAVFNTVTEIHAIQFPAGQAIPNDPISALALSYPKGSADVSTIQGQTVNLSIPGMIATADGTQDNLVVIAGYDA
jgi:hypothetical protein